MKTYPIIIAAFAIVFLAPSLAPAKAQTACTMQYDPVCGTKDGTRSTYGNACVAASEGAAVLYRGECRPESAAPDGGAYVPPSTCTAWYDGCNSCSRAEDGQAVCTLRACLGDPEPGYCTAYADHPAASTGGSLGERPAESPAAEEPASPSETPLEPETPDEEAPAAGNFFTRIWSSITGWFSSLF